MRSCCIDTKLKSFFFSLGNDEPHKMITSSEEGDLSAKQEGSKTLKLSTSSSSPWTRSKDPRIVRVSRAFGGKDRHSKVCTIKGLRDRRVRLSVPTAIQLYDLQDRLGLSQPSKVVDWLLNAAKHEIDELPPLPMNPEDFSRNYQSVLISRVSKSKEAVNEEEDEVVKEEEGHTHNSACSSSNSLPKTHHHASLQDILSNAMPYSSSYYQPSNFSLGGHGFTPEQVEDIPNLNHVVSLPSTLSLSTGSHMFGATQAYYPSHVSNSVELHHPRQSELHMFSSNSQNLPPNPFLQSLYSATQPIKPFNFSVTPKFLQSQNNGGSQSNKE